MDMVTAGAIAFGSVIGWCASLAIRGSTKFGLAQLATLLSTIGGAAVVALFKREDLFAAYAIGMAGGFFVQRLLGMPSVQKMVDREIRRP